MASLCPGVRAGIFFLPSALKFGGPRAVAKTGWWSGRLGFTLMEADVQSWTSLMVMVMVMACGGPSSDTPSVTPPPAAVSTSPATVVPASSVLLLPVPSLPNVVREAPSAAALAAARVRVEIAENLDSKIRAVLSSEARRFRTCYAQALERNPDLTGTMTLDVHLDEGRPTEKAAIQVDETGDWRLVSCVEKAVRDWAVPGGQDAQIAFVLRFSTRTG